MVKKFCDICGKQAEDAEEYVLPCNFDKYVTDGFGNKIKYLYSKYIPEKKDVCNECIAYIGSFIRLLGSKDDDDNITFNFKRN